MTSEHKEPVVVGEYMSEFEAEIIKNLLTDAGIPCQVSGGTISGFRAEAPNRVQVLVPAGYEAKARAILDQHEQDRPQGGDADD